MKLSREDITEAINLIVHPPKPSKIDEFGRAVEWDEDIESGSLDERSRYAACMPKIDPKDIGASLAAWETFAADMVKAVPASLRKAAQDFHKNVEKEFRHAAVYDDRDESGDLGEDQDDLLDEAVKKKLKKAIKFKTGDEIPAGSSVDVEFDSKDPEVALLRIDFQSDKRDYQTNPVKLHAGKLYLYVGGFGKPPSIRTMMKWQDEGMAKTVTGKKTEPDGVGPDGSPSWLRVLGYI